MIPGLDSEIGIGVHTTKSAGCGGRIKENVGDFEVIEELDGRALDGISKDSGYAVYIMRKAGMDTAHALRRIQKRTGQRLKALGLKDARATTEQYVCATSKSARLAEYGDGEVSLSPVGYAPRPLRARDMAGNAFSITVRDHDGTLEGFAEWDDILNFYAYQRFGSARAVTHLIGRAVLAGDWERATELILTHESPYETGEAAERRRRMAGAGSYAAMIGEMSRGMDIERSVAGTLEGGAGHLDAIRSLPVQMRRFYVQAYQSHVFNRALSESFEAGEPMAAREGDVCYGADGRLGRYSGQAGQELAMPVVGHSYYAKTRFEVAIAGAIRADGIAPRDFAAREMQEVAAEGGFRTVRMRVSRAEVAASTVHVALGRGSYATALMREVIKPEDPVAAGLAA